MMRPVKLIILPLGALLFLLAAACTPASIPAPTAVPPSPTPLPLPGSMSAVVASSMQMTGAGTELSGASLYQMSCAACHGADRTGNTFSMDGQTISVPALAWDDLNTMYSADPSRGSVADQLALAITKGQDEEGADMSSIMPRWSSLSQTQVDSLIQYVQTAGTSTGAASTLSPAATNLQGKQLFQAACAACHGQDRAGNAFSKDGQTISVPALAWDDLNSMYTAQPSRGSVAVQLGLAITKGQDEEGSDMSTIMPRWSSLSQEQVDSLVQYLQMAGTVTAAVPTLMPAAMATNAMSMTAAGGELTGASLFQMSCAACHGNDRAGNTFDQDGQKISVPALAWDDLNSMYSADPTRGSVADQLGLAVTKGQDETGDEMSPMMPRWSNLSQGQLDSLVQYIQTAGTSSGEAPALSPAATNLQGEQLYQTACAACHGTDGAGKTFEADGNTITTPSLHWDELSGMYGADPSRGSVSDQLALAITKGQNEEGNDFGSMMPRWSFLSQAQVDSLVQYFQTAFK